MGNCSPDSISEKDKALLEHLRRPDHKKTNAKQRFARQTFQKRYGVECRRGGAATICANEQIKNLPLGQRARARKQHLAGYCTLTPAVKDEFEKKLELNKAKKNTKGFLDSIYSTSASSSVGYVGKTPWDLGDAAWPIAHTLLGKKMNEFANDPAAQDVIDHSGVLSRMARPEKKALTSMVDSSFIQSQRTWNEAAAYVEQNEEEMKEASRTCGTQHFGFCKTDNSAIEDPVTKITKSFKALTALGKKTDPGE
eukprot:2316843-Pyramimonas_sp.AAC.1